MKMLRYLIPLLLVCAAVSVQAETGERVALVIGNSAYPKAPLANPRNDAKAMSDLLREAGFVVDQQLDTTQSQLSESVARFGKAIRNPKVKFGLFYYAGHGLQQDWRNYLVPVSADIRSADEVKKKTVDVSALLAYMDQAQGRSFLVILDACRDDPFAGTYRPPAKGLSQFDAPVGSLLAYATAPGNVALDGDGENGLYTSNLLREFSVRGVRVEDAFKRVRLSVRIASNGKQIPWESTSLEDDLYLFPSQRKTLSDEDQVKQLEQELSGWVRVKSSNDHRQLASYISEYPSGSLSELAQARLNRLLAARAREEAQKMQASAAAAAEAAERRRDAEAKIELARLQAEHAESQRLAAERDEQVRRRAAEAEVARQESARLEAVRQAEQQAEAARLADLRLKEAQAQAAELESQRLAAAAERQELAMREAARVAAAQEAERQATAAAAEAERTERAREAQEVADAQRRELARLEAARLEAQSAAAQKAERAEREREENAQAAALQAERLAREKQAQARVEAERLALAQQAEAARQAQAQRVAREAEAQAEAQRVAVRQQAEMARQAQLQAQAAAAHAEQIARERQAQVQAEAQRAEQARLALERLAAEKEAAAARLREATIAAAAATASQAASGSVSQGALVIAATPYYQGYEEHQRQYTRGDMLEYRVVDVFTHLAKPLSLQVTAVDINADRVEYNNGEYLSDTMGNIVANPRGGFSTPRQFYPAELYVGKKWRTMFRQSRPNGVVYTFRYDMKVVGKEIVTVPAGTFSTFKIEARGFNMELNARLERNIWVASDISGDIAHETFVRLRNGTIEQNDRQELVSFRMAGAQRAQR